MRLILFIFCVGLSGFLFAEQQKTTGASPDFFDFKNPWGGDASPAPLVKPYKLPRFGGEIGDHWTQTAPIKSAPAVDVEGLFYAVLACYPEKSKFRIEIDLEARYGNRSSYDVSGAEIGQHYAGIVARMPLYSASELSRERDREFKRRTDLGETIGFFIQALAQRNHALRELGLYSSLEARAQIRVAQGVAETTEQVRFLEKVAAAQLSLITAETALIQHRLNLISGCEDGAAGGLNNYIKKLAAR